MSRNSFNVGTNCRDHHVVVVDESRGHKRSSREKMLPPLKWRGVGCCGGINNTRTWVESRRVSRDSPLHSFCWEVNFCPEQAVLRASPRGDSPTTTKNRPPYFFFPHQFTALLRMYSGSGIFPLFSGPSHDIEECAPPRPAPTSRPITDWWWIDLLVVSQTHITSHHRCCVHRDITSPSNVSI